MEAAGIEASEVETGTESPDDGWLKRAGKAIFRGIGNTATYLGGMTAIGVTTAFGIAAVVPAFFGLVGGAGVMTVLGMLGTALLPFGGVALGALAAAGAGYMLAEAAGGSAFAEKTTQAAAPVVIMPLDDAPNPALNTMLANMTASPSFNDASPRASSFGTSPSISAAISAATFTF